MSFLNSLLGQVVGNLEIGGIATRFGIDPATAQQAIAALAGAHGQPGDTVGTAAAQTGLDSGMLGQIVSHSGGEGALAQLAQLVQAHPEAQSGFVPLAARSAAARRLTYSAWPRVCLARAEGFCVAQGAGGLRQCT